MIPVFSVVGYSNSGKTTLIYKLVKQFKSKGYRAAVIKHDPLDHGEVDKKGSDTQKFFEEGGADAVALSSPSRLTLFRKVFNEISPEYIVSLCGEVDCVILEGYKGQDYPKILLLSDMEENDLDSLLDKKNIIALVCSREGKIENMGIEDEKHRKIKALPVFYRDDTESIVEFLEKNVIC